MRAGRSKLIPLGTPDPVASDRVIDRFQTQTGDRLVRRLELWSPCAAPRLDDLAGYLRGGGARTRHSGCGRDTSKKLDGNGVRGVDDRSLQFALVSDRVHQHGP